MRTCLHRIEAAKRAALLFALVVLAGCYTYVLLPGDVRYETVSPPYVLQIMNRTGRTFSVEPSAYGKEKGFTARSVAADASLGVLLQVRRFRVGEKDGTGAHQVLDGPYIAQQGSDTAVIRVRHDELHFITIDLESQNWFAARATSEPVAVTLKIELTDFQSKRWFITGPP